MQEAHRGKFKHHFLDKKTAIVPFDLTGKSIFQYKTYYLQVAERSGKAHGDGRPSPGQCVERGQRK